MLRTRDQLPATNTSIKLGGIMAKVVMSVGSLELVAAITLGLCGAIGFNAKR